MKKTLRLQKTVAALAMTGAFLFQGCAPKEEALSFKKPLNIVLIVSDGHVPFTINAYDTLSVFTRTPGIDSLAKGGNLFSDFREEGGWEVWRQIEDSIPRLLSKNGYSTAFFGLWDHEKKPQSFQKTTILQGEGSYYNPMLISDGNLLFKEGYVSDVLTDEASEWLKEQRGNSPFMLILHHYALNGPWMPAGEDLGAFNPEDFPPMQPEDSLLEDFIRKLNPVYHLKMADKKGKIHTPNEPRLETMGRDLYRRDIRSYDPLTPGRMNYTQQKAWDSHYDQIIEKYRSSSPKGDRFSQWKYLRFLEDYLETANSIDRSVSRMMSTIEEEGLENNTVFIYTSTGSITGESSLKIPLIIKMPKGLRVGEGFMTFAGEIDSKVSDKDLVPTILQFACEDISQTTEGKALVDNLLKKDPSLKEKKGFSLSSLFPKEK